MASYRLIDEECLMDCDNAMCGRKATMLVSPKTTQYCANWFLGHYCRPCGEELIAGMKKVFEDDKNYFKKIAKNYARF
jgi:hypothetical protein